jgi:hypothetical protein
MQDIPAFTPHQASPTTEPVPAAQSESAPMTAFGGTNSEAMGEKISISSTSGGTHTETAIHQIQEWIMKQVTNLPTTNIPTTGILWGSMATALVGATLADWQRKREEEEVAREENFGDGRKGKKGKGGGDGGYHAQIQARQMADIIRVNAEQATIALEQQRQENIAAMHAKRAAAIAALNRLEMANKAAMEKAKEAARQKALEEFRAGERDRTRAPVPAPKKEEKSWWGKAWNTILQPVVNFSVGMVYQGIIRNNADSLTVAGIALLSPEKKEALKNYFQGWNRFEKNSTISDTFSFQAGKIVGGLLGIAQGIWEIGTGVATGTGGTVVSCGTVVLCVGGGGASLTFGSALVAHGVLVTSTSAYETGQLIGELFNQSKLFGTGGSSKIKPPGFTSKWYKEGKKWVNPKTGEKWYFHAEDAGHFDHWDVEIPGGGKDRIPLNPSEGVFKPR